MTAPPKILENPLAYLIKQIETRPNRVLIGLAGVPGSGKTTLTQKWAAQINAQTGPDTAKALSMDGFHLPKSALRTMPDPERAFARRGAHWTFDVVGFEQKIRALKNFSTESVFWPDFEHEIGDPIEDAIEIPPTCQLALVEGLYLLYRQGNWARLENLFDEIWYLDTPIEISTARLIARHQRAWGFSEAQARQRFESSDYKNALLVETTRSQADQLVE